MTLDVSRNKIKKLSSSSFLASLQHINLQTNEIQYIAANTFTQLLTLRSVRYFLVRNSNRIKTHIYPQPCNSCCWTNQFCVAVKLIVAGCIINTKLLDQVLCCSHGNWQLAIGSWQDVCKMMICNTIFVADSLGTHWWPSTSPPWRPIPHCRPLLSSISPAILSSATVTWTTSPTCLTSVRQVTPIKGILVLCLLKE